MTDEAAWQPAARNDWKSCVPRRKEAACRMRWMSSAAGICQARGLTGVPGGQLSSST
ncbi:MAG: hypothetical protein AAF471_01490 [Myxococcota bacterium]